MRSLALPLSALVTSCFALSSSALQNILTDTTKSDKYHYPTDFTREIVPKPFHSHNDYWRDVPFYSGLAVGAISTEADVWLIDGTLYVRSSELKTNCVLSSQHSFRCLSIIRSMNATS
jgi:hypothetical protein